MSDPRAQFESLFAAARGGQDAAAGLELAALLARMRVTTRHKDIDDAWELALATPWARPDALAQPALAYVARQPEVARALAQPEPDAVAAALRHLQGDRVFQRVASTALVTALPWLDLMRRARAQALREQMPGLTWIALQANLAEYVWPLDVPQDALARLRERVARGDAPAYDATLLACFEHPGRAGAFALDASDDAQCLLLRRLHGEREEERAIAAELVAHARFALSGVAQRDQYERYPYPRWIAEPRLASALPAAVSARLRKPWFGRRSVLLAGCGTGLQCMAAASTHPDAAITAIDFSVASMAYAVRKCREAGITHIRFEPADLLAYAAGRAGRFDLVECIGVLHHLTDLDAGAAALRALVKRGGLLRLAVYSEAARRPVHALRAMIAARRLDGSLDALRQVRAELLAGEHGAMAPSMLESPDMHSASGLHDLLFNACEHVMGAQAWCALMERHGFSLVCMDPPAQTAAQAGPQSAAWGPAEWERFEEAQPFAFASMYEFWFAG